MIRYLAVALICFSLGGLIGKTVGSIGKAEAVAQVKASAETLAKAEASVHQCVETVAAYNKLNNDLLDLGVECRDGLYLSGRIINRLTDMVYDWSCKELATFRKSTPKAPPLNEGPPLEVLRVDGSIPLRFEGVQ